MQKFIANLMLIPCVGFVFLASAQNIPTTSQSGIVAPTQTSFDQTKISIQNSYAQLYNTLPLDLQTRVRSASATIDNIRMMSSQEAQTYLASERQRSDQYIVGTISQMTLSDQAKMQVDNSRKEVFDQIDNRMNEFKVRRASHR